MLVTKEFSPILVDVDHVLRFTEIGLDECLHDQLVMILNITSWDPNSIILM
jgi:hypothetical protein